MQHFELNLSSLFLISPLEISAQLLGQQPTHDILSCSFKWWPFWPDTSTLFALLISPCQATSAAAISATEPLVLTGFNVEVCVYLGGLVLQQNLCSSHANIWPLIKSEHEVSRINWRLIHIFLVMFWYLVLVLGFARHVFMKCKYP